MSVISFPGFFSKVSVFIYTPTHNNVSSHFSTSSSVLGIVRILNFYQYDGYEKLSHLT